MKNTPLKNTELYISTVLIGTQKEVKYLRWGISSLSSLQDSLCLMVKVYAVQQRLFVGMSRGAQEVVKEL